MASAAGEDTSALGESADDSIEHSLGEHVLVRASLASRLRAMDGVPSRLSWVMRAGRMAARPASNCHEILVHRIEGPRRDPKPFWYVTFSSALSRGLSDGHTEDVEGGERL